MRLKNDRKTEKVRGMNASLSESNGKAGLSERDPDRLHITRRQIAVAFIIAILGAVAAIVTVDSVSSGDATFPAQVTTSSVYDLNFANTGEVTDVLVKVGQHVTAGQVLAAQKATPLQNEVQADEAAVKADQQALAQAEAPQLTPQQQEQDALTVQQAQTALANAKTNLASVTTSGNASVAAASSAVTTDQALYSSDAARYKQACPDGPQAPAANLTGPKLQVAQSAYTNCLSLQQQVDSDLSEVQQARAALPLAQAQALQADNAAGAAVNADANALETAQYQETAQRSPANSAAQSQAEATLTEAESGLTQAQAALTAATLTAPGAGTVAEVYATPGEYLGPDGVHLYSAPPNLQSNQPQSFSLFPSQPEQSGDGNASTSGTEPTIEVVGGSQQVTTQVPEDHISSLAVGHKVRISFSSLGATTTGVVTSVILNPVRNSTTVTYDVIVTLNGSLPGLLPGMSASVRA